MRMSPYNVFTFTSDPSTASDMLMYKSVKISEPSLLKYGCGFTFTYIIKSPAGPPNPEFPFFETLKFTPLSTPFGIFTVSFTC